MSTEALATNGSASDASVTPLINELVGALNTANGQLTLGSLVKRDNAEIAGTIAGIIKVWHSHHQ